MKYEFTAEPNLMVNVTLNKFSLMFDPEGKLLMSDDHPALERFKNAFPFTVVEEQTSAQPDEQEITSEQESKSPVKYKCKKCGEFEADNWGDLMAHYRDKHPKEKGE